MTSDAGGGHCSARPLRAGCRTLATSSHAVVAACALIVGILSLWTLARPVPWASAHERTDVEAVLDVVTPPLPSGIEVVTAPSVAQEIVVTNPTTTSLTVLSGDGQPFLRLDANGVQANVSSPDWLASSDPEAASQGAAQGSGQPTAPAQIPSAAPTGASPALPRWQAVLVRNSSLTHLVDGDQRTVQLPITGRSGSSIQAAVPGATVLPPGPYMLFLLQQTPKGLLPSVSRQVVVNGSPPA